MFDRGHLCLFQLCEYSGGDVGAICPAYEDRDKVAADPYVTGVHITRKENVIKVSSFSPFVPRGIRLLRRQLAVRM